MHGRTWYRVIVLTVEIALFTSAACSQTFPEWRGGQLSLTELWSQSPIIATGRMKDIATLGIQKVKTLGYPVKVRVTELYWCKANFTVEKVVKGSAELTGQHYQYIWPGVNPGCNIKRDLGVSFDDALQLWFLRLENNHLRPLYDSGTPAVLELKVRSSIQRVNITNDELAAVLLDGRSYVDGPDGLADIMFEVGGIAGLLAGEESSIKLIRSASQSENERLREVACRYLEIVRHAPCEQRKPK